MNDILNHEGREEHEEREGMKVPSLIPFLFKRCFYSFVIFVPFVVVIDSAFTA